MHTPTWAKEIMHVWPTLRKGARFIISRKRFCFCFCRDNLTMNQDYQIRNQCYSGRCLSVVTWCFCDGRVNKFSLLLSLLYPHPQDPPAPDSILSCAWLALKEGLTLPMGHPFSQPPPRSPGQMGACLLSLVLKMKPGTRSSSLAPLTRELVRRGDRHLSHLIGCISVALGDSHWRKFSLISKIRCHSWKQCAELIRLIERPGILIESIFPSCSRQIAQTEGLQDPSFPHSF